MNRQSLKPQNKKRFAVLSASICLAVTTFAGYAHAQTPEEKGYEIAARSDRTDRGFGDSEVVSRMILKDSQGRESERVLFQRTLEVQDETVGDKSIIVFQEPADIEGTALLSHTKILDPDDQWLYLPALKRVKRISSKNKSGPFVGSEFAFEDFTALELNKYDYKYLRVEKCPNAPELMCDVVERYPRYEHSGYTKQIGWIDQKDYQGRQVDYYDRKGDLLKTLTFDDYKLYDNKYWRSHTLRMVNHQNGKSTDFTFDQYKFGLGFTDNDFEKGVLKRVR